MIQSMPESIELTTQTETNDNNSDSGISPNDSDTDVLIFDRKSNRI